MPKSIKNLLHKLKDFEAHAVFDVVGFGNHLVLLARETCLNECIVHIFARDLGCGRCANGRIETAPEILSPALAYLYFYRNVFAAWKTKLP